jgi:hypothetical protein
VGPQYWWKSPDCKRRSSVPELACVAAWCITPMIEDKSGEASDALRLSRRTAEWRWTFTQPWLADG